MCIFQLVNNINRKKGVTMVKLIITKSNIKTLVIWSIGMLIYLYSALLQIKLPIILQKVTNLAVKSHFKHIYANNLVSILILLVIMSFLSQLLIGLSSEKIILNIRNYQFAKIINQSIDQLNKPYPEIANRLTNDTEVIGNVLSSNIPNLFKESLILIGSLFILLQLSSSLFIILLLSAFLFTITVIFIGVILSKYAELFKQAGSDYLKKMLNIFNNWDFIKVSHLEKYSLELEKVQAKSLYKWSIKGILLSILSGPIQLLFFSGVILLLIYIIGKQLENGTMSSGTLAAIILLLVNLLQSLVSTFNNFLEYKQSIGQLRGLKKISNILISSSNSDLRLVETKKIKYITLHNLYIKKQSKEILSNVSYQFKDSYYVISGTNGVGKTTLLKSILGLETISSGDIFIPENSRIAYIEQKPHFFIGTLRNNLAFNQNISDALLINALEKVHLWNSIKSRGGLDLCINDISILSGGEAQKLAIARALVSKFDILIVDEITSNLDREGIKVIDKLLTDISQTKQIIEVTHHTINTDCKTFLTMSKGSLRENEIKK